MVLVSAVILQLINSALKPTEGNYITGDLQPLVAPPWRDWTQASRLSHPALMRSGVGNTLWTRTTETSSVVFSGVHGHEHGTKNHFSHRHSLDMSHLDDQPCFSRNLEVSLPSKSICCLLSDSNAPKASMT